MSAVDCTAIEGTGRRRVVHADRIVVDRERQAGDGRVRHPGRDRDVLPATTPPPRARSPSHRASPRRRSPVALVGDAQDEADETFVFNLSGVQNATLDRHAGARHDRRRRRADAHGVVAVRSRRPRGHHAGGLHAVAVGAERRSRSSVSYLTVDGTAGAGLDYAPTSGTVTFPAGATGQSVNVPVIGDVARRAERDLLPEPRPVIDASPPASVSIQGTIRDDDGRRDLVADARATARIGARPCRAAPTCSS